MPTPLIRSSSKASALSSHSSPRLDSEHFALVCDGLQSEIEQIVARLQDVEAKLGLGAVASAGGAGFTGNQLAQDTVSSQVEMCHVAMKESGESCEEPKTPGAH